MIETTLYDEFFSGGALTDSYTILDRACYWEAANYRIVTAVEGAKPDKTFKKQMSFSLSEDDVRLLRLNSISILRSLCGFSERFNFAYPEYREG